jgi:decaprenylphospho-beta-D-erythro-pentofuranosid-2-ulose 2-reductase
MAVRSRAAIKVMLNGLNEYQKILVLGAKSDLALAILRRLPIAEDAEVILLGRNLNSFVVPHFLNSFSVSRIEIDFTNVEVTSESIDEIFDNMDIDLAIIAYASLGNEELQLDPIIFAEVIFTNFYSQALVLNQINTRMSKQMHGQILHISSVAGIRPRKRNFVYGVSKFGVDFIAQGLQKQNVDKNVFITILRPGFVHTKMTAKMPPAPFATEKSKVAQIAARALVKRRRIVYAPKILLVVMSVLKNLPERIFRVVDS